MRHFSYSALLLGLFNLGCHGVSAPSLTGVEPSMVALSELPREVTLLGTNLHHTVSLSLDDDGHAHRTRPQVMLNEQPVTLVAQPSSQELHLLIPQTMQPGEYDVAVNLRGRRLKLRAGLTIVAASPQLPDASFAPDATGETDCASSPGPCETGVFAPDSGSGESAPDTTAATTDSNANATSPFVDASPTLDSSISSGLDANRTSLPETSDGVDAGNSSDAEASTLPPATFEAGDAATEAQTIAWSGTSDLGSSTSGPSTSGDASLVWDASPDAGNGDAGNVDAGGDGAVAVDAGNPAFRCTPGEFGSPEVVTVGGYTAGRLWSPTLTSDGLTMYFTDGSNGSGKLMKATRSARTNTFVGAVQLPTFFPTGATGTPYLTPTGLSLYFYSIQSSGLGSRDLYVATRTSLDANFSGPTNITGLNSTSLDHLPWVSPDERSVIWVSQRDGQSSYWTATRPEKDEAFSSPAKLTELSLPGQDGRLLITYDGLRAYFVSRDRTGGVGSDDVWYATRNNVLDAFNGITNLGVVNTLGSETDVTLTHDGEELFFVRTGDQNTLYRAVANCD